MTLEERARIPVGSHPNSLAFSKDGRLFVANSGSNSVSVILGAKVVETISTSLKPKSPVGSTPDAVAISPDNQRLFVANADNNDVAVVDISDRDESRVIGFIPTGWYPSALAVSPDSRTLYIGTGKGLSFRANPTATDPYTYTQADSHLKFDYIGGILSGTVSIVRLPDAGGLEADTRRVIANTPNPPTPARNTSDLSTLRNIKHVVYIIRENRTYDQVLGDLPQGNGDPDLVLFGKAVTPNAHKIADDFVLLDNLYCNGEVSEDGHQWCDAAYATDFTEKSWPNNYSGRGEPDVDDRARKFTRWISLG